MHISHILFPMHAHFMKLRTIIFGLCKWCDALRIIFFLRAQLVSLICVAILDYAHVNTRVAKMDIIVGNVFTMHIFFQSGKWPGHMESITSACGTSINNNKVTNTFEIGMPTCIK